MSKKTRVVTLLTVLFLPALTMAQSHELWERKLAGEGGVQSFERSGSGIWPQEQGIVFLSPERVLAYQVNEKARPAALAKRSPSGGGGNFVLLARIFDASSGREIKRMQFVTTADYSAILPTHDGRFIIRAGDVLALFSPNFELLLEKTLPLKRTAPVEYWQVRVTPSGKQLALLYQQIFLRPDALPDGTPLTRGRSQADLEILNADTFETVKRLHLPYYLPLWSAQEQFLLTTVPEKPLIDTEFGTMDFEGHWTALHSAWEEGKQHCPYNVDLLDHDLMAARGCSGLVVFSASGQKTLELRVLPGTRFGPIDSADYYLAAETEKYATLADGHTEVQPLDVGVYDLKSRERVMSVKLKKHAVYYTLSTQGVLAVVDGDILKVYAREK